MKKWFQLTVTQGSSLRKQPLYLSFYPSCLASAIREDSAAAAPAGAAAAARTRSFNPWTTQSVAQLDPSALFVP